MIRSEEKELDLRKQCWKNLKDIAKEYIALLDNYHMYETDVWLNAWMVIQYLEANKERNKNETHGRTMSSRKPKTGFIDTVYGEVQDKMKRTYLLPFENDADGFFCKEYLVHTLGNTGALFRTEQDEEEEYFKRQNGEEVKGFKGYAFRINIVLHRGKDYSRFGYQKIERLEKQDTFKLEDRIMFHKTINGILLRNMVNCMMEYGGNFEAEDFLYLIKQLCKCKSLVWQNMIGCLFILLDVFQKELISLDLYSDLYMIHDIWLAHVKKINYTLHKLTEGFIYLYYDNRCNEDYFKQKCNDCLRSLELESSKNVKKYWEDASQILRVTADIKLDHKNPAWFYAILQREVIHTTKNLYRNNQFCEKPLRNVIEVPCKDGMLRKIDIPSKIANFQPMDMQSIIESLHKDSLREKEEL